MAKESKNSMYNKLTIKDILVVILSIVALVVLVLVVKHSNDEAERLQAELDNISSSVQNNALAYEQEDALSYLQFSEIGQEGFVEFSNTGTRNIDLSGYKLVIDGVEDIVLEEGSFIEPDQFLVVACKDAFDSRSEINVCLYDREGNLLRNINAPALKEGYSYAQLSTTNLEFGVIESTRGAWNGYLLPEEYEELTFSVPSGCYNDDFYLSLYAPEGATIYYTLDGTEPTVESQKYTQSLFISNTSGSDVVYAAMASAGNDTFLPTSITRATVVRAICVNKNGKISDVYTNTYLVGLKYATDLQNMPIISISIEPEDMFNYYDGIYVRGRSYDDALALGTKTTESANYLNGWTKKVIVEYFEPCKDRSYIGEMMMQVANDYSSHAAQKSFMLTGASQAEGFITSFSNFVGDDGSVILQTNKRDNTYKVREYIAAELLQESAVGAPDLSPCAVFIDGEYWGCYMLRRPYGVNYVAEKYDVSKESVQMIVKGVAEDYTIRDELEDLYGYVITTDMAVKENYEEVKARMDMQSYAEYLCANMFLANSDFGLEYWTLWRSHDQSSEYGDGKWRCLMPEIDSSMDNGMVSKLTGYRIDSFLMPSFSQDYFIQSLLRNDEFCSLVQNTMEEMMDDCFVYENVETVIDGIANRMNKPATSNYRRFNGFPSDTFFTSEIDKIKTFFMERTSYMSVYTRELPEIRGMYIEQLPLVIEEEENSNIE